MPKLDLESYFYEIQSLVAPKDLFASLGEAEDLIRKTAQNNGTVFIFGNGAGASIASHVALDLTKQAKIRTIALNDATTVTAFANDCGFENWAVEAFKCYRKPQDLVICLSASGESQNLIKLAKFAVDNNHSLITFSGHSLKNPLNQMGEIKFHVNTYAYNIVEGVIMLWLTSLVDMIIGKSVYSVNN
jgi:D-sedoheptulose 7-phosphate isomerase